MTTMTSLSHKFQKIILGDILKGLSLFDPCLFLSDDVSGSTPSSQKDAGEKSQDESVNQSQGRDSGCRLQGVSLCLLLLVQQSQPGTRQ